MTPHAHTLKPLAIRKNNRTNMVFVGEYPLFKDVGNEQDWVYARLFAKAWTIPMLVEALKAFVREGENENFESPGWRAAFDEDIKRAQAALRLVEEGKA